LDASSRDAVVCCRLLARLYYYQLASHSRNLRVWGGTLVKLAQLQALEVDGWCDAQTGKTLHEIRQDELAQLHEIPHTPYYGKAIAALTKSCPYLNRHLRLTQNLREAKICLLMFPISSAVFQGKFIFGQLSSSLLLLAPLHEN
jgi:hypothetical protein